MSFPIERFFEPHNGFVPAFKTVNANTSAAPFIIFDTHRPHFNLALLRHFGKRVNKRLAFTPLGQLTWVFKSWGQSYGQAAARKAGTKV